MITLVLKGVEPISTNTRVGLGVQISTSVISLEESLSGWYTYLRKAKKPDDLEYAYDQLRDTCLVYASFEILTYTAQDVRRADSLAKIVKNVRKNDLRIAAIALNNNATVVTANIRDFQRVPGLNYEDWTLTSEPRS